MNRRGWLGRAATAAGSSLLGLVGVQTASGTSSTPAAPWVNPEGCVSGWIGPYGETLAGRVLVQYWQDVFVPSPGCLEGGRPKILFSYRGVSDCAGIKGWMTRFFCLTSPMAFADALSHLDRMITDAWDFTDEERAILIRWRDTLNDQALELTKERV